MAQAPTILDRLSSPGPYHILSYGTLLGSTVFQSFIGGIVAFRALPRPQFATLQSNLFPIYFAMQTALPAVLALTYPGSHGALQSTPSSLSGVLAAENRWSVLYPLAANFAAGAINMLYLGPKTTSVMRERKHQETKDGKKSYDKGPHSPEMQRLNKTFGKLHGASSLVNLLGFFATIWYGFSLSDRLQ